MMKMEYARNRDQESLEAIEIVAHLTHDAEFDLDVVDEYAWKNDDFKSFPTKDGNRHHIYSLFEDEVEPTGYVAYTVNNKVRSVFIDKLESLRDEREIDRIDFILRWLKFKAERHSLSILVQETENVKIKVLNGLGFVGTLRKNAFSKNNRDGILFARTYEQ